MARLMRREKQAPQDFEAALWARGVTRVAGLDEAGRGCLAGPVSAGAVVLRPEGDFSGIDDSKILTEREREHAYERIFGGLAMSCAAGLSTAGEIDALGIVPATRLAMARALAGLDAPSDHLLIDAMKLPDDATPQTAIIDGDARSISIAAASIVAKVTRDRFMRDAVERDYPGYGFARHKGYGTAQHLEALRRLGPCPLHRRSFAPVSNMLPPPEDPGLGH
jgi:ribonuclease HII